MPYTKQVWVNGDPATPLNQTRLNAIEEGIETAQETAEAAAAAAGNVADGAVTNAKVASGAAISADKLADGTTNKIMTAAERTKLAGVATGATANSTDAQLRDRTTHTGSQTAATISDFTEAVQDVVGAFMAAGTGATVTYNDAANTITIAATGSTDLEAVRDAIGVALVGVGVISVAVDDAANTITISSTATANSTDAQLRDRSTHTGSQAQSTITNLTTDLAARSLKTETVGVRVKSGSTDLGAGPGWPLRPSGYALVNSIGADPSPTDQAAGDIRSIPV